MQQNTTSDSVMQDLFLFSLFLYPFSFFGHTAYLIPQALFLAIGIFRITSDLAFKSYPIIKFDLILLALATLAPAIAGEVTAGQPEYFEVGKLALNTGTIILLLFSPRLFGFEKFSKWMPRFAFAWLLLAIMAYVRSGTTVVGLVLLFSAGPSVSSSSLYNVAEPLDQLFLTKNISAMFVVACYGLFLYSCKNAQRKANLGGHAVFILTILAFMSRQGILSVVAMIGLFRLTSGLSRWRRAFEISIAASLGAAAFAALFNLSSPDDGAYTRLELWRYFMRHTLEFVVTGLGIHGVAESLSPFNIDNYHMFFMNQIGTYGIIHCAAFNLFLLILIVNAHPQRGLPLLVAPYWLNVCFQTYGYEYGNLFLFMVAANTFRCSEEAYLWADTRTGKGDHIDLTRRDAITAKTSEQDNI